MSYQIKTPLYSGPFDLLLKLVTKQKVDIGTLSLSEVANQYLAEVDRMQAIDLDVASDFVLVASTLLDMKAASLVPQDDNLTPIDVELDADLETLSADEAREVLIARLIAYKQFRNAAASLGARMQAESRTMARSVGPDPQFLGLMPDYLEGITLRGLAVICADLNSRKESFLLEASHIAPKKIPLATTVVAVDRFLKSKPSATFTDLLDGQDTPEMIVVTFLALLELFKRGNVSVSQEDNFEEITITRLKDAEDVILDETLLSDDEDM